MNNSFNKNREKQLYSSKLFSLDPNIYTTYKKMQNSQLNFISNQNTSQTSLETINKANENGGAINKNGDSNKIIINNNYQNSIKDNKNRINKQHISYIGFLKSKGNTFTREKRFKWQNLEHKDYPTGISMIPKIRKHVIQTNNDNKEYKFKRQKKYVPTELNDDYFNKTKRVIYPDNNGTDKDEFNWQHKKVLKCETIGGVRNLINKTPLKFYKNGIRIVKRNNSGELNLFSKDDAKYELPKVRQNFIQKCNNDKFIKKNKSMDFNEGKNSRKFKKKTIDMDPINWIFPYYENYY